jgi:hypothetical protein
MSDAQENLFAELSSRHALIDNPLLTPGENTLCCVMTVFMGPKAIATLTFLRQQSIKVDGETDADGPDVGPEQQRADMKTFKCNFDKVVMPTMASIKDSTKAGAKYIQAIAFLNSCRMMQGVCKSAAEKIKAIFTGLHEDIALCRPVFAVCVTSLDRCALCVANGDPCVRVCGVSVDVPGTLGVNNGPYRREGKTLVPGLWWMKAGVGGVLGTEQIRGGVACPCGRAMKLAKFRQGESTDVIVIVFSDQAASSLFHGDDIADLNPEHRFALRTKSISWQDEGPIQVVLPNEDGMIQRPELVNFEDLLRIVCITQLRNDTMFPILKGLYDRNWDCEDNALQPDIRGYSAHLRLDASNETVRELCEYSNGMKSKLRVLDAWAVRSEMWSDQCNFIEHQRQKNMSGLHVQYKEGRSSYARNRRARGEDDADGFETREYLEGLGRNATLIMAAIARERERTGPNSRDFLEGRVLTVEKDEQTVIAREGEVRAQLQALEKCGRVVSDMEKHYARLATDAKAGKALLIAAITGFAGFKRMRETP